MICNQENEKGNEIRVSDRSFQSDLIGPAREEQRLKANLLAIVIDKSVSTRLIFPCEWNRSKDASAAGRDIELKPSHLVILIEHSSNSSLHLEKFILSFIHLLMTPHFLKFNTFKSNEVTILLKVDLLRKIIIGYEQVESFFIETHVLI